MRAEQYDKGIQPEGNFSAPSTHADQRPEKVEMHKARAKQPYVQGGAWTAWLLQLHCTNLVCAPEMQGLRFQEPQWL